MARSSRPLVEWAVAELAPHPADEVLEIGCGPGTALALLAEHVTTGTIVGVDSSAVMVQQARRRLDRLGLRARARVVECSAEQLPFGNAAFDGALAINTLHLLEDRARGLSEVRRTLRRGSRLVVVLQPPGVHKLEDVEARAREERELLVRAGFDVQAPAVTGLRSGPALLLVAAKRERRPDSVGARTAGLSR